MQRFATTILALLAILGTAGAVQAQQADTTESTEALVQRGAAVYSRQCQRCHVPRSPGERGDRDWIIIMQHMQARANLTREQARAALAFLLASNRSARRPAPERGRVELTERAVTDAVIAQGRTVFRGTGGCAACHGADLAGGPIAPSLVDAAWKNGDGSLAAILDVIRAGVEGTAMAAYPGGITEEQAARVAAYVWAVSQGRASP